jgi:hypothetical protein
MLVQWGLVWVSYLSLGPSSLGHPLEVEGKLTPGQRAKDQIAPSFQLHLLWSTSALLARYIILYLEILQNVLWHTGFRLAPE